MDSTRQAGQQTTQQEGGAGDDVRQVTQGNPATDDTTRGRGWRTWDNAKGGGNGDDDDEEEEQSLR
jgi:hypothetical protein